MRREERFGYLVIIFFAVFMFSVLGIANDFAIDACLRPFSNNHCDMLEANIIKSYVGGVFFLLLFVGFVFWELKKVE